MEFLRFEKYGIFRKFIRIYIYECNNKLKLSIYLFIYEEININNHIVLFVYKKLLNIILNI